MKFAFLGYGVEENWDAMSNSEQDAMFEECFAYDARLLKQGHLIEGGAALQPSWTAKTLRWHKDAVVVTDGPYAETKEQLGGIGILEAADMMHAVELMSKHPGLHYGATFEIRPINEEALRRREASIAALLPPAPAPDSQWMRFASLGYTNGWGSISEDQRDAMMTRCIAFDEGRVKSGQMLSGIALEGAGTAKTLRGNAGQVIVTDGPFAETKEYLGGIVVLAHKDLNEGVATLSKHPALPFGLVIEIRPMDRETKGRWEIKTGSKQSN